MNDLLARIRGGSDSSSRVLVRVDDAVAEVLEPLANRVPAPGFTPDAADETVNVDPRKFKTVLANLVRNAQDATGDSGRVSVATRRRADEVLVDIADTGAGMSASFVRDHLFEPFYTTKSTQGMGIGAYEAREFARATGGELDVASQPGQGTTITLRLPSAQSTVVGEPSTSVEINNVETA
jgi:signal transduction histidine kinase